MNATLVYITESHAPAEPADQGRYERSDRYKYILELDADRNIIGGERIGGSQTEHPDFLWSPRRAAILLYPILTWTRCELIRLSREPEMPEPAPAETKEHVFERKGDRFHS